MASPGTKGRIKGLRRVFVAPLDVDTSGATTYGTAIQIGAQAELTWQPNIEEQELVSSLGVENSDSKILSLNWSIKFGEKNLDFLKLLRGGKLFEDSAGGKSVFAYGKGSKPKMFGLFAQPELTEGGPADYYICLLKCKVGDGGQQSFGTAWQMNDLSGKAMYTLKDGLLWGEAFLSSVTEITAEVALADLQSALTSGT